MDHPFLTKLRRFDDADAIVFHEKTHSYRRLLELVDDWQSYLEDHEVRAGQIVTLEGECSPQTCAGLLALIARGAVIVPLTTLPDAKRDEFLDVAEAEVVIQVDSQGERQCTRTERVAKHELYRQLRERAAPGLLLFSSGTTGRSKASVLDFDKVLTRYTATSSPHRILSFLNLDHIGGVNTLLHTLSQGGALITVTDRTPDVVFAAIAAHRVEVLPTTPTFLNMVLISGAHERHTTDGLQMISYGTEPMPLQTLQRLKSALPHVRFKQTYGLSELGILPTRSKSDDTLWIKLGNSGFDHKIIDGILWIRSDMAMLGYLNAPAAFDSDGFFNTQDAVETDGEWVHILGHRSEVINVGGEKVYPSEVESVLLEMPNIAEATVSGRPSPVTGMVVKATVQLVEPEDHASMSRRVRASAGQQLEQFKVPVIIDESPDDQHSERFKKIRSTE
jgi:acyl-coenzyme A synthetase/AMP-(fatty) acid ligase